MARPARPSASQVPGKPGFTTRLAHPGRAAAGLEKTRLVEWCQRHRWGHHPGASRRTGARIPGHPIRTGRVGPVTARSEWVRGLPWPSRVVPRGLASSLRRATGVGNEEDCGRGSTPKAVPGGAAGTRLPRPRGTSAGALGGARRFLPLQSVNPQRPGIRVLRGPPDGQRPAGPSPRLGPGVQGPDLPVPDHDRSHGSPRRAGWDTHGLAVEVEVEKALGLSGKDQIEEYGVDRFVERCRRVGLRVRGRLGERSPAGSGTGSTSRMPTGRSTPAYIDSVWWHLSQIWESGDLFEDLKVVPYCPRCGTSLSSHELGQPDVYQDIEDLSAPTSGCRSSASAPEGADALVVWTTTPWTLVGQHRGGGPSRPRLRGRRRPGDGREQGRGGARARARRDRITARFPGERLVGVRYRRPHRSCWPSPRAPTAGGWCRPAS